MAKKQEPSLEDKLFDLEELYHALGVEGDALLGEVEDAAEVEAALIVENIMSESVFERLKFLYLHGYELGRLEEIIRELKSNQT